MNYRELINIGLTEKESKVYLASLKLGKSAVQKIATTSKVNRATTYVIIENLMEKGLMSSCTEGKKQFFIAESPEKLSLLFREQQMEIQKKQEYLDKILPELKSLKQDDSEGPVVRYYEGKEGLRAMAEELYISEDTKIAKSIYSADLLTKIFTKEELSSFRTRRKNQKTKAQVILNDDLNQIHSDAVMHKIPSKQYNLECDISFYDDIARIATLKKPYSGLIIKNKEISSTLEILFDLAWKYLELTNKKKRVN